MLQLRPNCECCNTDLAGDSDAARICSFECTFCARCADEVLQGRCPNCGGTLNLTETHPQQFLLLQNMMPAPYCGYENVNNNTNGTNLPTGNCFVYVPNEWMTFQVGITCGARVGETVPNSRFRLWGQRRGQASVPIIDRTLTLAFPSNDPGYGKFWFTNYNAVARNNLWRTWVSELIISTRRIPDAL